MKGHIIDHNFFYRRTYYISQFFSIEGQITDQRGEETYLDPFSRTELRAPQQLAIRHGGGQWLAGGGEPRRGTTGVAASGRR
jgi:hypothetical protein